MKKSLLMIILTALALLLAACETGDATPAPDTGATATLIPAAPVATEPAEGAPVEDLPAEVVVDERLTGVTWQWLRFQDTGEVNDIAVDNPAAYTLTLQPDGTANIQADCNQVIWTYTGAGASLTFNTLGPSTLAFCGEESLDQQYLALLGQTATFVFDDQGSLVLNLFADSGNMYFTSGMDEAAETEMTTGLDPAQISLDTRELGVTYQATSVAATSYDESQPPGPMGLPEHIEITFGEGDEVGDATMYIIPATAYRQLWEENGNAAVATMMAAIESYVNQLPSPAPNSGTPVLPYEEIAGVNDLSVKLDRAPAGEESASINGYRFVGRFMQGPGPVVNGNLRYMYMGFTMDGQYLVAFFYPVTNTTLPNAVEEVSADDQAQADADISGYLATQAEQLNASTGADWQPGLATLDAVVSSLTIEGMADSGIRGRSWQWAGSRNTAEGTETLNDNPQAYVLNFGEDGVLNVQADCNTALGAYSIDSGTVGAVSFELGPMTLVACPEGSRSDELLAALATINAFRLRAGGGQLELVLPDGAGEHLFTIVAESAGDEESGGDEAVAPPEDGEAPLIGTEWQWEAFQDTAELNDVAVADPTRYTLTLAEDGTFLFVADCNSGNGSYVLDGPVLTMEIGMMTLVACEEGSLSDQFLASLANVATFVQQDGKLYLNLIADAGNMVFTHGLQASEEGEAEQPPEEPAEQPTEEPVVEPTEEPEAEVTPSLTGVVWQWIEFQDGAGLNNVAPADPSRYTLVFNEDGTVNIVADCNTGFTTYSADGGSLSIDMQTVALTRALCPEDSLDTYFLAFLNDIATFVFTEDGNLALNLRFDTGNLIFADGGAPQ